VKCCQNGELSDRRRTFPSAMRFPHPLAILDETPLGKAMLGRVSDLLPLGVRSCVYSPVFLA
jgi:hypothetical protein